MKRRKLITLCFVGFVGFMCSCNQPTPAAAVSFNNPNGQSELSMVMRALQAYSADVQNALQQGGSLPPYPDTAKHLLTAQETEGMIASRQVFNGMAQQYLLKLDSLYSQPKEHHIRIYNNTIQSCIQCHQEYCMGPIPAIKKLFIKPLSRLPQH